VVPSIGAGVLEYKSSNLSDKEIAIQRCEDHRDLKVCYSLRKGVEIGGCGERSIRITVSLKTGSSFNRWLSMFLV